MRTQKIRRVAMLTGITGQDGSYLAELLLDKGYEVHGCIRDRNRLGLVDHLSDQLVLHTVDLNNAFQINQLIQGIQPDEYYHLAAVTFIPQSLEQPLESMQLTAMSALYALEAIRQSKLPVRFFQAGSSEMFGRVTTAPQDETTPFRPANPYAAAKVFAHHAVQNYRDHYGIYACNGILFNHESPRRGMDFVTRKITSSVARISLGLQSQLVLGSLDAERDWGFAGDFAEGMWRSLQQDKPSDYVLGTGELTSVGEFAQLAFGLAGLDWKKHTVVDPKFVRPKEPVPRVANISRARKELHWEPTTSLRTWVAAMLENDMRIAAHEAGLQRTVAKAA